MGICVKCGAEVSEDKEICEKCKKLNENQVDSDESYLDSLLNSMKNTQPSERQDIPKKKAIESIPKLQRNSKQESKEENNSNTDDDKELIQSNQLKENNKIYSDSENESASVLQTVFSGIDSMPLQNNINNQNVSNNQTTNLSDEAEIIENTEDNENSMRRDEEEIQDKKMSGKELEDFDDLGKMLDEFEGLEAFESLDELENLDEIDDWDTIGDIEDIGEFDFDDQKIDTDANEDDEIMSSKDSVLDWEQFTDNEPEQSFSGEDEFGDENITSSDVDGIQSEDTWTGETDFDMDTIINNEKGTAEEDNTVQDEDMDDLLGSLLDNLDDTGSIISKEEDNDVSSEMEEQFPTEEPDDLADLLNSFSFDEGNLSTESDVLAGMDLNPTSDDVESEKQDGDSGLDDIFSLDDMFSSLENDGPSEMGEQSTGSDIGDVFADSLSAVSSAQDSDLADDIEGLMPTKKAEKKKKVGLLARLFGNVPDDNPKKQEDKPVEKKNKKSKKKGATDGTGEDDQEQDAGKGKKGKSKKEKKSKGDKKEKIKKEKKVKAIMEEEVDEGKINKVGAAIVFIFFGILCIAIIIGTNIFSYSISVHSAQSYFENGKYEKAFQELDGTTIKADDQELYDKIYTIMVVNKELNSYENYYSMKMYPDALDSLLKGLEKYDEHIEDAANLDVEKQLKTLRGQIITNLSDSYDLTEEQAYKIIDSATQEEYSSKVITAANGN